ncbi:MAG: ParA family protein [Phycisphaerae bacterium]|nr:ParA family protein [Phycisphaerae bacterium]
MRTIAVINQKGGVGKTTTVANLGAALGRRGRDVCLIDLDPQAHLTLHFGIEPDMGASSIYDVLTGETTPNQAARKLADNLHLVPSVIDLAAAEMELSGTVGREQILSDKLRDAPPAAEIALIDCPPSLGLLTLNALAAADEVYIPLQAHFLALQGLGKLLETVALVSRRINPRLRVAGVILCMYESTTRLAAEVLEDLKAFVADARGADVPWADMAVFDTVIRRNVKLAECPSYGVTIFDYEPRSHGAADYNALADEFLARAGAPPADVDATPEPTASASPAPTKPPQPADSSQNVTETPPPGPDTPAPTTPQPPSSKPPDRQDPPTP